MNGVLGRVIPFRQCFTLCVELLACKSRACNDIKGFLLPGANDMQFKVGQYADDIMSFVKDVVSLNNLFKEIHLYEHGTGARLNISKTEPCCWGLGETALTSRLASSGLKK